MNYKEFIKSPVRHFLSEKVLVLELELIKTDLIRCMLSRRLVNVFFQLQSNILVILFVLSKV